jgi:hypothetical protein
MRMSHTPLPSPRLVICQARQMRNVVPATRVAVVDTRNERPGSVTREDKSCSPVTMSFACNSAGMSARTSTNERELGGVARLGTLQRRRLGAITLTSSKRIRMPKSGLICSAKIETRSTAGPVDRSS